MDMQNAFVEVQPETLLNDRENQDALLREISEGNAVSSNSILTILADSSHSNLVDSHVSNLRADPSLEVEPGFLDSANSSANGRGRSEYENSFNDTESCEY